MGGWALTGELVAPISEGDAVLIVEDGGEFRVESLS